MYVNTIALSFFPWYSHERKRKGSDWMGSFRIEIKHVGLRCKVWFNMIINWNAQALHSLNATLIITNDRHRLKQFFCIPITFNNPIKAWVLNENILLQFKVVRHKLLTVYFLSKNQFFKRLLVYKIILIIFGTLISIKILKLKNST